MPSPLLDFEHPDFMIAHTLPLSSKSMINTTYQLFDAHENGTNTLRGHYDSAIGALASQLALLLPDEERRSVDCLALLDNVSGPILEIGGPTPSGYKDPLINPAAITRKIYITNTLGKQFADPRPEDLDMYMDGTNMPFKRASLGFVMASCMPKSCYGRMLDEVYDKLEPGGLVQLQSTTGVAAYHAMSLGDQELSSRASHKSSG
jgi:hypothetical protein